MNVTNNVNQMVSLYTEALEASGVDNVAVAASEDGKSLTVTMHGADGSVTGTKSVSIPEIDVPAGSSVGDSVEVTDFIKELNGTVQSLADLDDATFDALEKNVQAGLEKASKNVAATQTDSTSSTSSSGKTSALYCIYKLMSLMLEVAREQREVARETRQADTQMMLTTMENQRQAMINEAITGMICCACVAAIQTGMLGISVYKDASVSSAREDASRITGDKTFKQVAGMAAKSGDAEALGAAKQNAATKLDAAVDKLVGKNQLPRNEREAATNAHHNLETEFRNIDSLTDEQVKAEGALNNPNATREEINDFKAQKRTEVYERCKNERTEVKQRYEAAAEEGKVPDKLRQEMDLANAKVEYAAACKLSAEAQPGNAPSVNEANGFKTTANSDAVTAANARRVTLTDRIAEKQLSAQRTDQITQVVSQLFKGLTEHGLELQKAENKKYDQSVAMEREKLDSTKDLVQNALDMFKQMLSVLSSVHQAEKDSIREILG